MAAPTWPGRQAEPAWIAVRSFSSSTVVASLVYAWFCYEAYKLCLKMKPDESAPSPAPPPPPPLPLRRSFPP